MNRGRLILGVVLLAAVACDSEPSGPEDACMLVDLPLSGGASGPTIVDVGLEVQEGSGIVVVATATDPQGTADLEDVIQSVGVFRSDGCEGAPIVLQDDLVGSGVEETFGTAVEASTDPALYGTIAAAASWPVEIAFSDKSGNRTSGRVSARVFR